MPWNVAERGRRECRAKWGEAEWSLKLEVDERLVRWTEATP